MSLVQQGNEILGETLKAHTRMTADTPTVTN